MTKEQKTSLLVAVFFTAWIALGISAMYYQVVTLDNRPFTLRHLVGGAVAGPIGAMLVSMHMIRRAIPSCLANCKQEIDDVEPTYP